MVTTTGDVGTVAGAVIGMTTTDIAEETGTTGTATTAGIGIITRTTTTTIARTPIRTLTTPTTIPIVIATLTMAQG